MVCTFDIDLSWLVRPDLVVKKDVYAKVRDLVSLEDRVPLVGGSAASLVKEAIVDQGADIEGHGAIGLDAMTQVILLLHKVEVSLS